MLMNVQTTQHTTVTTMRTAKTKKDLLLVHARTGTKATEKQSVVRKYVLIKIHFLDCTVASRKVRRDQKLISSFKVNSLKCAHGQNLCLMVSFHIFA